MSTAYFRPRKRFGQHFLTDQSVITQITDTLAPQPEDCLVEIGPGQGALTQPVLKRVPHLYAVEIDRTLSAQLQATYPHQLTLYTQNALQFNFATLKPKTRLLRIFGNLPYNISTPLLFHLLTFSHLIQDMVFMLQKEIVDRITAPANDPHYGRLSVMLQYACQTQALFDISPHAFTPAPKVMSSIIHLRPYQKSRPFTATDFQLFTQLVSSAFGHRRKTLNNNLKKMVPASIFDRSQIEPSRRPQTLTVTEFVTLSNNLASFTKNMKK